MATKTFPGGIYPTMLTPFTQDNKVDYVSLGKLIDWYMEEGSDGLFAVCQSSEMFYLSLEERIQVAKFVKEYVGDRVPVISSGHVSYSPEDQAEEVKRIADTGVDAVILVTNRLADASESDDVWIEHLSKLLNKIPDDIALGFYECPYPYKRVMSLKTVKFCADTGRFYFLKDTCCDAAMIRERIQMAKGSNLKIYNANTATLLETLRYGASGYSGIMANFQTKEYKWLYENYEKKPKEAEEVAAFLTMSSFIETHLYPAIAKNHLMRNGILGADRCRTCNAADLTATNQSETDQLVLITKAVDEQYGI